MGSLGRSGQRRETLLLAEVLDLTTEEVGDKEAGLNLDLHVEEAGETHLDLHSRVAPHPRGLLFRVGLHLKDLLRVPHLVLLHRLLDLSSRPGDNHQEEDDLAHPW